MFNRVLWRQFIAKLNGDQSSLALIATMVLNANVAFLALVVDDALSKTFSYISAMTSVGVMILGQLLVHQHQRRDQNSAEKASERSVTDQVTMDEAEILKGISCMVEELLVPDEAIFL
ncbi:uncharacterized protein HD556DRAFT_1311628 [Suillus plorans]|uniref:Uncharacterized protein n=1 Tax=Suillus plorans TaxID=116603 RepID=A0A9P7DDJ0_9AGAM|nr:uncharacterized protein HD556DRAFT_1311628 [Suillus plorans]KAG1789061.1 hypothetical protein HD556DRAFT_1311628 [Suillus plorans]